MNDFRRFFSARLPFALAVTAMLAAGAAQARSISVDPGFDTGGNASWEQNFGNVLDDAGDTGEVTLPFTFFGASTLFVSNRGVASFGAPIENLADLATAATPFLTPLFLTDNSGHLNITFDWGGQTRDCDPAPGDCGPDGESDAPTLPDLVPVDTDNTEFAEAAFRVTWSITDEAFNPTTATQMVVWLLQDGNYVVEFNYDFVGIDPAASFAGFNLGSGNDFDASTVSDYVDLTACPGGPVGEGCAEGNNYIGERLSGRLAAGCLHGADLRHAARRARDLLHPRQRRYGRSRTGLASR